MAITRQNSIRGPVKPLEFRLPPQSQSSPLPTGVAAFDDPMKEYLGFDITLKQGFLSLAIAESNYGDNVELPPTLHVIASTTLMGYRGYYVPQRILAEFDDPQVERIQVGTIITDYTWDNIAEQQFDTSWRFSSDDESDMVEVLPQLYSWQDLILISYSGYRIAPANMLLADEGVERVQPITTIYNDWTNDSENQIVRVTPFADEMFEGIEAPLVIYNSWDNDADNQHDTSWHAVDDVYDDGISQLVLTGPWDNIAEQQFDTTWRFSSDDNLDNQAEAIPFLFSANSIEIAGYKGYWIPKSSMILIDEEVERIQLPYNDWTNDGDNQLDHTFRFSSDDNFDNQVERIQPIVVIYNDWTNDSENQLDFTFRFNSNDESDMSELVQPYHTWDNDSENQHDITWHAVDDIYDDGISQLLVNGPWDNTFEQQFRQSDWSIDEIEFQDRGLLIQPYRVWNADEDNQLLQLLQFGQDTLLDERVEYITLPPFIDEVDDLVDE